MFYRVCLSVHANALRTAGTQAPTAPRWPHHHEYCMMGTWGDEIISKGNPIIFSPTLHLFHISSLHSSISPPSFKREQNDSSFHTSPLVPLDSPAHGFVCSVSAYEWVGVCFPSDLHAAGDKRPQHLSFRQRTFSRRNAEPAAFPSSRCEFLICRKTRKCHACVC